jgi:site-specific DNA-adenine methylase
MKPFLKWAGSKRRIAPKIAEMYKRHRQFRLVEPFCGGLSIALGLAPDQALLNDINPDLILLYRRIQKGERSGGITSVPEFENTEQEYYRVRDRFKQFEEGDYKDLAINPNDFLFVDPPYDDGFTSYSPNTFGWQQQIELADWLDNCSPVPMIACNKATDRIV